MKSIILNENQVGLNVSKILNLNADADSEGYRFCTIKF